MAWGVGVKPIVPKGTKPPPRYLDGAADPNAPAAPPDPTKVDLSGGSAPSAPAGGPAPIPGVNYAPPAPAAPAAPAPPAPGVSLTQSAQTAAPPANTPATKKETDDYAKAHPRPGPYTPQAGDQPIISGGKVVGYSRPNGGGQIGLDGKPYVRSDTPYAPKAGDTPTLDKVGHPSGYRLADGSYVDLNGNPASPPSDPGGAIGATGQDVNTILDTGAAKAKGEFDPAKAASTIPSSTAITDDQKTHLGEQPTLPTNNAANVDLHTGPGHVEGMPAPNAPTESSTVLHDLENNPPPNLSKDAYGNLVTPKYLADLAAKGMELDPITGLARQRREQGYGVDPLTGRVKDITSKENDPTLVEGQMRDLGNLNPSMRTDGLTSQVSGSKSASGKLLDGYDPTKTMAVGDVYHRIAADTGPSASEKYFEHMMAGDDPSLLRARGRMTADAERSAAAVGGFSSGQKMRLQREQNADFEAKQVKYLGDLAGQSDTAKAGRYATLQNAANPYDQTVMQGRNLQATLAGQADTFTTGKNKLLGDLATSGDTHALDKIKLGIDAGDMGDKTHTTRIGQVTDATVKLGEHQLEQGKAVDAVTGKASDIKALQDRLTYDIAHGASQAQIDADKNVIDAARNADTTSGTIAGHEVTAAGNADQIKQASDRLEYDMAHGADQYTIDQDKNALDKAKGGDISSGAQASAKLAHEQYISDLAAKASGEQNGAKKEAFSEAMQIAENLAGIDIKTTAAKGANAWNTMMAQVEVAMRKANMDAQKSQNVWNNLMSLGGLLIKGFSLGAIDTGGGGGGGNTSGVADDGGEGAQPGAGGGY